MYGSVAPGVNWGLGRSEANAWVVIRARYRVTRSSFIWAHNPWIYSWYVAWLPTWNRLDSLLELATIGVDSPVEEIFQFGANRTIIPLIT